MAIIFMLLLLVGLITSCTTTITGAFGAPLVPSTSTALVCKETERIALVEFKKHFFKDPSNKLISSWEGGDCCSWEGVRCDSRTGNIVQLDLRCHHESSYDYCLGGEISPSLLHLQHLTHIDFSRNNFYGTSFPAFITQFKELRYLNLSRTFFMGLIPTSLGNLSNLQTLDLSYNYHLDPESSDHQWLSHLTSLQHLVMNGVDFGNSSSLFLALNKLPSIKEIRLSGCWIETIPDHSIPHLNFSSLAILDLSENHINFSGCSWVFNLKTLEYLDLSYNYFDLCNESSDHQWLSHLTSLQHFVMNGVNFENSSSSLFLALNKLPSIKEIRLSRCRIETIPDLSIPHLNFSSLAILDLSHNFINFSGCSWVFNLKTLEYLDLSSNWLYPRSTSPETYYYNNPEIMIEDDLPSNISIPESMGSLCSLQTLVLSMLKINKRLDELGAVFSGCMKNSLTHLYLRSVSLKGVIPDWIWDMKNLKVLDLSDNSLSRSLPSSITTLSSLEELLLSSNKYIGGTLPEKIGELGELINLDLYGNQLTGVVSEAHFAKLKKLEKLDMYGNSQLVFNVSSNWVPPFLLQILHIRSCSVGPGFPTWLRTQHKLDSLDMSYTGITGTIPDWFWNLTKNIGDLSLSNNQIEGMLPKYLNFTSSYLRLDLSSNWFYGPLPEIYGSDIFYINLSNNSFSGPILRSIAKGKHKALSIFLSENQLNGSVPSWLCQTERLMDIDLSKNHLSGELPADCWSNSYLLENINLASNNIIGSMPHSICYSFNIQSLQLSHNKFSGEFPLSLKNCSQLEALDLSYNNFTGSIPVWVRENLPRITILKLKANSFAGHIPNEISQLTYLHILDLADNNFSGLIPKSMGNIRAMRVPSEPIYWSVPVGEETMSLSFRGREDEYNRNYLPFVTLIDLSSNDLSGLIPEELASLCGLLSLNLSGNQLEGEIPSKLGRLKQLESLDLSRNKLSGIIPSTFSNLTSLSLFNVSHNNLSGRIPSGNQFNTFVDPSIYIGNHLCGFPLIECIEDGGTSRKRPSDHQEDEDNENNEMIWLYIGSISGFAVGFWTVWGVLAFKKKWRHAYFRCTDNFFSNIYVYVVVSFRRMKNKITTNY